jgi:ribosomal protein S18 acetylase RimI-like enzyme
MYNIRPATLEDAPVIVDQRRGMFLDIGFADDGNMAHMLEEFRPWLEQKMSAQEYMAWVAVSPKNAIVAGLGLWLIEWPPHLIGSAKHRGYILNVYTHPNHRRQGLAKKLTQIAVKWCEDHKIDFVFLHASQYGKSVYEALGFKQGSEMRLRLPAPARD